jgi:hypothetical protein
MAFTASSGRQVEIPNFVLDSSFSYGFETSRLIQTAEGLIRPLTQADIDAADTQFVAERQADRNFYLSSPDHIPFGAALSARYAAAAVVHDYVGNDGATMRAIGNLHPDMGVYSDGLGNFYWGPLFTPAGDSAFDSLMQKLTVGVVAVSVAIGAGYAIGAGVGAATAAEGAAAAGAEGAAAAGAAESGAVATGVDASTGLFAGESAVSGVAGAEITGTAAASTGIDASTGLFAGESATSGAAGSSSLFSSAGAIEAAQSAATSLAKSTLTSKLIAGVNSLLKPKPAARPASSVVTGPAAAAPAPVDPMLALGALLAAWFLLGGN